jgi:hypothetical protein
MLTQFTTPDEVRAVLAVAEQELPDRVINLPMYHRLLQFELREINTGIEDDYLALPSPESGSQTAAQELFYNVMQVFAAYSVARQLVGSQPMFAPQVISASDTSAQRAADPYESTRASVEAGYNVMLARLKSAYLAIDPSATLATAVTPVFALAVGIATDPVTDT